ncbi:beta-lactamase family protein [Candidatus Binatia bacterium]|nr:beta-lactamase family protein [Candidatus Binatia bacterium]
MTELGVAAEPRSGSPDLAEVEHAMDRAVAQGVFPGAVLLVRDARCGVYRRAFGHRSLEPTVTPMREDTIFDVSSLTKPFATTAAIMLLVRAGRLRLDDRVSRVFHNFGVYGKTHVTVRHLLSHCSGLPAWRPFYEELRALESSGGRVNLLASPGAKTYVYHAIERSKLDYEPGTRAVYSDLGFILLGALVEDLSGEPLDRFCKRRIFQPLGLRSTAFVDLAALRIRRLEPATEMIAPTERCPWRNKVLCGEVHDDNAWAMGGISGHAGLFSSAGDLDRLLCHLVECYSTSGGSIPQAIMREFWSRDRTVPDSTWCLGWDSPSPVDSSAGRQFSPHSVGHLGFTGTSVWLDLEQRRHVILLSNRVHPRRDNDAIRAFRPRIHDLIVAALQGKTEARGSLRPAGVGSGS